MIRKLIEIKNLAIFNEYRWDASLPQFERFNLIYGWNGSGKTTLSQIFSEITKETSDEFPNLKYKIETDNGEYTHGAIYSKKIRVFNQNYITQNIDVLSGKASSIYIIGEENKKLADSIREDELILRGNPEIPGDIGKLKELEIKKGELGNKESEKGNLFTTAARNIGTHVLGAQARNYRKNNAESDFRLLDSKQLLPQTEVDKLLATLLQQEMPILSLLSIENIESTAQDIIDKATALLKRTVELTAITRLQENPHISQWVEKGFELHQKENSLICEFCNQPLPEDRLQTLAKHFNLADKELKTDADNLLAKIVELQETIQSISPIDKANLYPEFRDEYTINTDQLENAKKDLLANIKAIKTQVENKKLHTTEEINLTETLNVNAAISAANLVNAWLSKHNEKSTNFSNEKDNARAKLKKHHLSEIFDDVQSLNTAIANFIGEINILENGNPDDPDNIGIKNLQARIQGNKNKISEAGRACDEINRQLEVFLGRRELVFESTAEGYLLKRNGERAKNLSEGEKTAIAFVYFTIHLKDRDFTVNDGVVVIDDPISSLDSNSLFQAFSFLKNAVRDSYQVFILTHNFDFLQLIINWFQNMPNSQGRKSYYMIKNLRNDEKRIATLAVLDKLLKNYNTEYQYLFKILYRFTPDGTLDSVYHLPNIARKVLENFLMIMYPDNNTPYKKLEQINFDENKKTAIYKFTNDQSHITGKGFNPALVSESQNVIAFLLDMMHTVFPDHYKALEDAVINSDAS